MSDPDVAIIIPTLGRTDAIERTVENVTKTAPGVRMQFVIEDHDTDSRDVLAKCNSHVGYTAGDFGTYAKCINAGYLDCPEPIVMTADDDCVYHDGWLESALAMFDATTLVVGTNDLHNPYVLAGEHSTHSLLDRRYIDQTGAVVDQGPGSFMFEYDHNYTDAELIETAKARGVFAPCLESRVEHIHPDFGGREPDDTWRKTRRNVSADHSIFQERRKLWEHNPDLTYHVPESP